MRNDMSTGTQRAGAWAMVQTRALLTQRLRDYVTLTKPHIISLLLVTTAAPMVVASGGVPDGWLLLWTMIGGYLMAGSANATNMFIDRDVDARMSRTSLRPIPSGRLSPTHVLGFALLLGCLGLAVLTVAANPLAALLSLAGWVWYVGVYTLGLKRSSPQNIVIGGAAGAFPVLVGWAAVTGNVSVAAFSLFLVVFLWTPPHFWALALVKCRDYEGVGVPMAPGVWGPERTIRQMIVYAVLMVATSLVPVAVGTSGLVYGAGALLLGLWFILALRRLADDGGATEAAWTVYRRSLLYLALLFAAIAIDTLVVGIFAR
jgi:protoheme IX farnesyltransferase